jgi:NADH:ubiquinone oxidoreductase subunit 6 (subunit J)
MLDLYAFYFIAAFTVISALAIFFQNRLIRAVVALTAAFIGSALLFLLLHQTLIAILQLIVFVGGLSTYLIVAVATELKSSKLLRLPEFATAIALLVIGLSLLVGYVPNPPSAVTPSFLSAASEAFQSQYITLYIIVVLLFAITISGTLIIRKFTRLIV